SHDQGRTASMLENFFSVAAKQKVLPASVAMCRYEQEIGYKRSCASDDFIAGVKSSSLDRVDFLVLKLCPCQLIRQSFLCFLFQPLDLLGWNSFHWIIESRWFRNDVEQRELSAQTPR